MLVPIVNDCECCWGGAEWIESINVERWLNVKLQGEIKESAIKLDIHNDHAVKIINTQENKADLVSL